MTDARSARPFCVFDLDGTLIGSNSTFSFISFILRRESIPRFLLYQAIRYPAGAYCYLIRTITASRIDLYRDLMLTFIKGMELKSLEAHGKEYSARLLQEMSKARKPILEMLLRARRFSSVYVVSRTIVPLQEIERQLGVRAFFSMLATDKDGRVRGIVSELKKDKVVDLLISQEKLYPFEVVSDSIGDLFVCFPIRLLIRNSRVPWRHDRFIVEVQGRAN